MGASDTRWLATHPRARWQCITTRRQRIAEVIPLDDLRQHIEQPGRCWCGPTITHEGKGWLMYAHNSADGRELVEEHGYQ